MGYAGAKQRLALLSTGDQHAQGQGCGWRCLRLDDHQGLQAHTQTEGGQGRSAASDAWERCRAGRELVRDHRPRRQAGSINQWQGAQGADESPWRPRGINE